MIPFVASIRFLVALLAGLWISLAVFSQIPLELHGKRILFIGDSITNKGTYISFISYFLQKGNPELDYDIISIGLGSETAAGTSEKDHPFPRPCIHSRLDRALEETQPDIVFACYGMNDGIYHPLNAERFLDYQDGIESLVGKIAAKNGKTVLLTPPLFDAGAKKTLAPAGSSEFGYKTPYAQYNDVLRTYGKWILLCNLPVSGKIDLNTPMLEYNRARQTADPGFHLAKDGVHPGELGHLLMAVTILKSFDAAPEGELVEILEATRTDPLFHEIDKRRQLRSKGWLEYIGYERAEKVKTDSVDAIEAEASEIQAKIDALRRS